MIILSLADRYHINRLGARSSDRTYTIYTAA